MSSDGGDPRGITSACAEQTPWPMLAARWAGDHLRVCGADALVPLWVAAMLGSPPRVRSRLVRRLHPALPPGITSACAEQTHGADRHGQDFGDHLRVCGADVDGRDKTERVLGSPPRVRSRLLAMLAAAVRAGITSACAEQTGVTACGNALTEDHLRVCGADQNVRPERPCGGGSPPRVRSRPQDAQGGQAWSGITSACAEQTTSCPSWPPVGKDHLRVCGADLRSLRGCACIGWITSACAEQTNDVRRRLLVVGDHLRVCGADEIVGMFQFETEGSPPRVRSRLHGHTPRLPAGRITSSSVWAARGWVDHLRVCGADHSQAECTRFRSGSPPRVRSRQLRRHVSAGRAGITSACAEQTTASWSLARVRRDHLRVCGADAFVFVAVSFVGGSPPRVRSRLPSASL